MRRFFLIFFLCALMPLSVLAGDGLWDDEVEEEGPTKIQALPVTLRKSTTIQGVQITLGDIFSGLNAAKDSVVAAPAPVLGKDVVLTADWLKKLAQTHNILWHPANNDVQITIKRDAKEVKKEEIIDLLKKSLKEQGLPEGAEISLQKGLPPILIPTTSDFELEIKDVDYNHSAQVFQAKVIVTIDEKKPETHALTGRAQIHVMVPTAKQNLAAGQIVTERDIFMKRVPQETGRRFSEPSRLEDLIGKEVKRGIRAGQNVSEDDVRTKVMVSKGKTVTLSFTKGGIMLSAQGKALENGGLGDTVRVLNTQSKTVVEGTVTGPEMVTVINAGIKK